MQKITPFLWFNDNAEEAVDFYLSVFSNSKILNKSFYGGEGPGPAGSPLVIEFQLEGQNFTAMNAGSPFSFNPAISLMVNCDTQSEVDAYWDKFSQGGEPGQCGWIQDKYGVSWQITPVEIAGLMTDPDPVKSGRTMQAMLQMTKLDIAALKKAHAGL